MPLSPHCNFLHNHFIMFTSDKTYLLFSAEGNRLEEAPDQATAILKAKQWNHERMSASHSDAAAETANELAAAAAAEEA